MLYQIDMTGVSVDDAVRTYWANLCESRDGESFADTLVRGVTTNAERIDERIRETSHHWRIDRMTRVDRNILRLATYELLEVEDIPRRVTLNEAVELAKRFGSEGSAGFVNGVLDRIAGDLGKD